MKTKFTALCLSLLVVGTAGAQTSDSLLKYDYRSLVAHSDLSFNTPAPSSHDGLPIGNGRVGTLVWTTPAALHYQINHVDLFCFGNNTLASSKGHTDYSSGCGYVDINMVDFGNDVFDGEKFNQHLSVFEGLETTDGDGVKTRSLAWTDGDVIATEVDDQRSHPSTINIDLRMLRYAQNFTTNRSPSPIGPHGAEIRTGDHVAISRLDIRDGKILLTQEFTEGNFYSASAVAIGVAGRETKPLYYNEMTVRLSGEPRQGKMLILTATAVSYDRSENVGDLALKQLAAAQGKSFDGLLQDNRKWWGHFWNYYSLEPSYIFLKEEATYVTARRPGFTECYDRYDANNPGTFRSDGISIIVPKTVAQGKPWMFTADLIERDSTVEQALLAKGYHIVIARLGGSGAEQKRWDDTYKLLVDNGFSSKPVLKGTGPKAGEAYAWAIANPGKVSCIYARNPYMHSLMAGNAQPIDNLAALAKASVPLLHDCGASDPWLGSQTRVVEKRYKELGGKITVIVKEGEGHFPTASKDPKPVVDFITTQVQ